MMVVTAPIAAAGFQDVQQVRALHARHEIAGRREDARPGNGHHAASGS